MSWAILLFTLMITSAIVIFYHRSKRSPTVESFFVANRSVSSTRGTLTLTANWFQAPATLLSGNLAFAGIANFLVFWIPNTLAMALPAIFVEKIKKRVPRGYTIPQFMGAVHGEAVRFMFNVSVFGALIGAMSYTLAGLTQWLEPLGVDPLLIAGVIAVAAYLWALPEGVISAIKGDMIKVAALCVMVFGAIAITASYWSDPSFAHNALRSTPSSSIDGWTVFWGTGIALAISLFGGVICNPDLGERTFVGVRRGNYVAAATLFGLGVLATGSLGFLAWHLGITPAAGELATYALLKAIMPSWVLFTVSVILVVVLTAAFASMFASAADLLAIEFVRRAKPDVSDAAMVGWSRALMLVPILIAAFIATRDKSVLDLGVILQSLAVIRGEAIVPIIIAVFFAGVSGRAVFWGMLLAFIGGIAFTFGDPMLKSFTGTGLPLLAAHGKPLGALWALAMPAMVATVAVLLTRSISAVRT